MINISPITEVTRFCNEKQLQQLQKMLFIVSFRKWKSWPDEFSLKNTTLPSYLLKILDDKWTLNKPQHGTLLRAVFEFVSEITIMYPKPAQYTEIRKALFARWSYLKTINPIGDEGDGGKDEGKGDEGNKEAKDTSVSGLLSNDIF